LCDSDQASFIDAQRAQVVLQLQQQGFDENSIQMAMQEYDAVMSNQVQQQAQLVGVLGSENYKLQLQELVKQGLAALMADKKSADFPVQKMLTELKNNYQEVVGFGVYFKSMVYIEATVKNLICFTHLPL